MTWRKQTFHKIHKLTNLQLPAACRRLPSKTHDFNHNSQYYDAKLVKILTTRSISMTRQNNKTKFHPSLSSYISLLLTSRSVTNIVSKHLYHRLLIKAVKISFFHYFMQNATIHAAFFSTLDHHTEPNEKLDQNVLNRKLMNINYGIRKTVPQYP